MLSCLVLIIYGFFEFQKTLVADGAFNLAESFFNVITAWQTLDLKPQKRLTPSTGYIIPRSFRSTNTASK